MRILLTGKDGQVGWELNRTLLCLGDVVATDRHMLDLSSADSIQKVVREVKPNLIVNPAAYTAVDKAESEPELAMAVNGIAPGIMAEEAKRVGAMVVHYSTDYVFDGMKHGSYTELDKPNPLSVYGKTKLAGEEAIRATGAPHLIFRTSWVYGTRGKNFLRTILRLAKERDELRVVDDQIGAPTWSRLIAEATASVLARLSGKTLEYCGGVYHLTASGQTSWFGFTQAILEHGKADGPHKLPTLHPMTTSEYPLPAIRPQNSVMSTQKLAETFNLVIPTWDMTLKLCLASGD